MIKAWNLVKKFDSLFFLDEEGEGGLRYYCYGANIVAVLIFIMVKGGI